MQPDQNKPWFSFESSHLPLSLVSSEPQNNAIFTDTFHPAIQNQSEHQQVDLDWFHLFTKHMNVHSTFLHSNNAITYLIRLYWEARVHISVIYCWKWTHIITLLFSSDVLRWGSWLFGSQSFTFALKNTFMYPTVIGNWLNSEPDLLIILEEYNLLQVDCASYRIVQRFSKMEVMIQPRSSIFKIIFISVGAAQEGRLQPSHQCPYQ